MFRYCPYCKGDFIVIHEIGCPVMLERERDPVPKVAKADLLRAALVVEEGWREDEALRRTKRKSSA